MLIKTLLLVTLGRGNKWSKRDHATWRRAVLKKTGGKCFITGTTESVQAAHKFNVKWFPFLAFQVWNGVPLHIRQHARFDDWTGASKGRPSTIVHWWLWRFWFRFRR